MWVIFLHVKQAKAYVRRQFHVQQMHFEPLVLFKSSMFGIRKRRIALLQFVYLEWSMIIRNFPFALLGVGSLSFQFAFVLPLLRFLWKVYSKSKFLLYTG